MLLDFGAFDEHNGAHLLGSGLRLKLHVRDGRDGGESLAAETLRGDAEQVVGVAQLRSGVPLEAETRVIERHALAVVDDLDEGAPGILDHELDLGGAGVDGVLQQLLDHGGGPLHYLAGRNLVRHRIGQQSDDVFHLVKGLWLRVMGYRL